MSIDADLGDRETVVPEDEEAEHRPAAARRRIGTAGVVAYGLLPALALTLTLAAGYLKWQESTVQGAELAQTESLQAAKDAVAALLSYQPDTAEQELAAAQNLLTADFKAEYARLTEEVVIPAAKQQKIGAQATVPAAASISAAPDHAVALVLVNQTVTVGADAPTDTASSIRVSMQKVDGRWLISDFTPV